MRGSTLLGIGFCVLALGSSNAFAQQAETGITVMGSVVLERSAERMTMQIDLLASSSKDLSDALAMLKERRAEAEKQLEQLGAIRESVKFGDPQLDHVPTQQQRIRQMIAMRIARQQGVRPDDEADKPKPPVKIKQTLTAEWSLKATDSATRLLEATKLQDAVKDANLSGKPDAEEMTDEEEELAMQLENNGFDEEVEFEEGGFVSGYPHRSRKPGEPAFAFVARISDTDRDKATTDAFADARAKASRLAKAAGIQLGTLVSLKSGNELGLAPDGVVSPQVYQYASHNVFSTSDANVAEAIGQSPGVLKYKVSVQASFAINVLKNP